MEIYKCTTFLLFRDRIDFKCAEKRASLWGVGSTERTEDLGLEDCIVLLKLFASIASRIGTLTKIGLCVGTVTT